MNKWNVGIIGFDVILIYCRYCSYFFWLFISVINNFYFYDNDICVSNELL